MDSGVANRLPDLLNEFRHIRQYAAGLAGLEAFCVLVDPVLVHPVVKRA